MSDPLPQAASARSEGLELAIAVERATLGVTLANRGDDPLTVYFAAEGPSGSHHDFLTVELAGDAAQRTLRFTGGRNASTPGLAELAPGQAVSDDLDLAGWALDPINGSEPLAAGEYALTATYRAEQPGAWSGSIVAGPVRLVVSAPRLRAR